MRIIFVWFALAVLSCSSVCKNAETEKPKASIENISQTINYLSSDNLQGRATGTEGNRQAAEFLSNKLKDYAIKPYYKSYNDTLENIKNSWNIVGVIPGTADDLKKEVIVLGAHYDHIGIRPAVDGDTIANGANDNASGSAVLLELARNIKLQNKNKRTVLIVFFTGEEKGLLGSEHLAKKLKIDEVDLVAMLNFEMLGVPMKREYMAYLTGYDLSNIGDKITDLSVKNVIGNWEDSDKYQLFKRSDNYPFYRIFRVPSHTISSFDYQNFEYYHHVKDEAEKVDLSFMTNLTNELIPIIGKLVNLPTKELSIK
ncbi:M20/M25/M40 family metallo-hydrolase [Myroides indicus]|uniref:Peptidase M28-like protein n=1 Tax=Myroides indicus TaxID=1323422 RepID=A0A4R7F6F8_9FLAO|nr:M20/M25/M40 family metallo-hydrolase [Myroides indicus]TDS65350.1 peptidase M28-like protein [Myroides indicus]